MLLDAAVQAGIVVDRTGKVRGIVTVDQVADFTRRTAEPGAATLVVDPAREAGLDDEEALDGEAGPAAPG